jgi:hypothetical protein
MMLPDNNVLDIIISLVLIYALLSILVSILLEWYNAKTRARSKFLRKAIFQLLKDPLNVHYGELFYNHYLIEGFKNRELKTAPQYISSQLFSEVLIDIIANRKLHDNPVKITGQSGDVGKQYEMVNDQMDMDINLRFDAELNSLNPSPLTDTLRSFWQKSDKDTSELKGHLKFWFDDYMDRVSGWYKKKQQRKLLWIGFLVAIMLNVDALHLLKILSLDDALRNRLVATAEDVADHYEALSETEKMNSSKLLETFSKSIPDSVLRDTTTGIKDLRTIVIEKYPQLKDRLKPNDSIDIKYIQRTDSVLGILNVLNIPIGWDENSAPLSWKWCFCWDLTPEQAYVAKGNGVLAYNQNRNFGTLTSKLYYVLGILISGISLSFGAPFWFDTLVKLVNIRRAGKKPEAVNETTK